MIKATSLEKDIIRLSIPPTSSGTSYSVTAFYHKWRIGIYIRDVNAGATGATAVTPKSSDTLILFQLGGADSAPTPQRSHQNFFCGYISVE